MSSRDIDVAGPFNYAAFLETLVAENIGEPFEHTLQLDANETKEVAIDFPSNSASFIFIQTIIAEGGTDTDMSIHEGDNYDKTDMIYRVSEISVDDETPTGGYPNSAHGLPYVDSNQNNKLYLKASENSGIQTGLLVKIKYLG